MLNINIYSKIWVCQVRGRRLACRNRRASQLLRCATAHEHRQLAPDFTVKHQSPILRVGWDVGEAKCASCPWDNGQLLHTCRAWQQPGNSCADKSMADLQINSRCSPVSSLYPAQHQKTCEPAVQATPSTQLMAMLATHFQLAAVAYANIDASSGSEPAGLDSFTTA